MKYTIISIIGIISVVSVMLVSVNEQVQANILHDLGDGVDHYRQGKEDGKNAGARGENNDCPSSSKAYCLGWGSGYYEGQKSRETVDRAYGDD
jgi:hypothetical protein